MMVLPCYINVSRLGDPPAAVPAAPAKRPSDRGNEARSTADSIVVCTALYCLSRPHTSATALHHATCSWCYERTVERLMLAIAAR